MDHQEAEQEEAEEGVVGEEVAEVGSQFPFPKSLFHLQLWTSVPILWFCLCQARDM